MFEDSNNKIGQPMVERPNQAADNTAAEDMFAAVESAPKEDLPKPPVFRPKESSALPASFDQEESPRGNKKKLFVLGGIVVGLIIVITGGWYGFKTFVSPAVSPETFYEQPASQTPEEPLANPSGQDDLSGNGETTEQQPAATGPSETISQTAKDSDDDGLTDQEEANLGTNPNEVDTDRDGLFDFEEVKVYGTDPLNADTDGDGFLDGQEVKSGHNPLGMGKLFDVENPKVNQ